MRLGVQRVFDVAGAAGGLVFFAPVMAVVAVAIRIDDGGAIVFRQERLGERRVPFTILKFRSMRDGRTTRVGRVLRASGLDELPQLLNVLRGDMSLVGPRPLVPEEDANIAGLYRRRLDLRPGITGHWQVLGSSRVPLEEMVKLDYMYVSNWSLWSDLVLIARTVPLVMRRRGL
jgi:lipopolysaccharide/colanic/teichoic acid biosynthesis glycosyltransferase